MNSSLMLKDSTYGFSRFSPDDITLQKVLFLFITESCINKGVRLLVEGLLLHIFDTIVPKQSARRQDS